ncbi:MAG: hypothetical protein ACK4WH_10165 [Phycisphaerales bacterium]
MLDRFDCYELCVQSPRHITAFLRAAHGNEPGVLREDFCGTAAVSRRWVTEGRRSGDSGVRATAADLDGATLAAGRRLAGAEGVEGAVRFVQDDCIRPRAVDREAADVLFVGNFSIGYIHRRADLLGYLRRARGVLSQARGGFGGGVLACDTYGGAGAFRLGGTQRRHPGRHGEVIHYTWVHESADPVTGMVENSIGFRVERDGEIVQDLPRAFVYRWRLWSIAELREAMLEAGFAAVEVYKDVNVAPGQSQVAVADPSELGEDWIVMLVART